MVYHGHGGSKLNGFVAAFFSTFALSFSCCAQHTSAVMVELLGSSFQYITPHVHPTKRKALPFLAIKKVLGRLRSLILFNPLKLMLNSIISRPKNY